MRWDWHRLEILLRGKCGLYVLPSFGLKSGRHTEAPGLIVPARLNGTGQWHIGLVVLGELWVARKVSKPIVSLGEVASAKVAFIPAS